MTFLQPSSQPEQLLVCDQLLVSQTAPDSQPHPCLALDKSPLCSSWSQSCGQPTESSRRWLCCPSLAAALAPAQEFSSWKEMKGAPHRRF